MRTGSYVTHQDLLGPADEDALAQLAEQISVEDFVASLGKLSWLLERNRADVDRQLSGCLPRHARRRFKVRHAGEMFAFQARLLRALRFGVEHGSLTEARSLAASDQESLVRIILGVADLYEDQEEVAARDIDEWFTSTQLRQSVYQSPHRVLALTRIWRLFVDLPPKLHNVHHEVGLADIPGRFQARVGMSVERYLAICAAVSVRFENWEKSPDRWGLTPEYFLNTGVSPEEFGRVTADLAADVSALRSTFDKQSRDGVVDLWDVSTFLRYPLCELRPNLYLPLAPAFLLVRLLGDGFYW